MTRRWSLRRLAAFAFVITWASSVLAAEPNDDSDSTSATEQTKTAKRSVGVDGPDSGPVVRASDYAHWWVGVAGAVEFLSLPAGTDVCKLTSSGAPANSEGYYCTNPDGSDFPKNASQNNALIAGQAGHAGGGGLATGDVRAMVALDYAISPSFLLGGRFGYVANTYPGNAAVRSGHAFGRPLHIEARGTYLFGSTPLASIGFSPMVFTAVGASEFDGRSTHVVAMTGIAGDQPVDLWLTGGPFFFALGAGARYQFSVRTAFTGALRVNAAVGSSPVLITYGPEVALQYGF